MPIKITTKRCNSILCQRFRPNGRKNFSLVVAIEDNVPAEHRVVKHFSLFLRRNLHSSQGNHTDDFGPRGVVSGEQSRSGSSAADLSG